MKGSHELRLVLVGSPWQLRGNGTCRHHGVEWSFCHVLRRIAKTGHNRLNGHLPHQAKQEEDNPFTLVSLEALS